MVTHITVPQPANAPPQYLIDTNIEERKTRLIELKRDFDEALAALNAVGSNNVPVAEKLKAAAKVFYDEIDRAINEVHNKVDKQVQDSVVKEMIDQLYDTDKYSVAEVVSNKIRTTQMVYDQTMVEANLHREQSQLLAKDDITNRVSGLINLAKKADKLNVDNERNLNESINRLKSHTKSFGDAQNHNEMQRILNFFSDEFKIIEKIIDEAKMLPKESIEFFKSEADQLRKMIVTTIAPSIENIQTRPSTNSGQDSDSQSMGKKQDPVDNTDGLTRIKPLVDSKDTPENISAQVADDSLIPPPIPFVSPYNMAAFAPVAEHLPSFNPQVLHSDKTKKNILEMVLAQKDLKVAVQDVRENGENKEKAQVPKQPIDVSNIEESLKFIAKTIKKLIKTAQPNDVDLMNNILLKTNQLLGAESNNEDLQTLSTDLNKLLNNSDDKENFEILSDRYNDIETFSNQRISPSMK